MNGPFVEMVKSAGGSATIPGAGRAPGGHKPEKDAPARRADRGLTRAMLVCHGRDLETGKRLAVGRDRWWIVAGAWASAGAALWLASLGSLAAVSIAEGVAAAIAAALAALAAALRGRAVSLPDAGRGAVGDRATPLARRAPVPVRWPPLARLPVTVLTDTGRVFAQATRGSRTGALRVVDLDAAGSGSEAARGRAVATLLLGVTPGT